MRRKITAQLKRKSPFSGKSFTFSDRGEFAMKGFDDAVRLYEVQWRE